METKTENDLAKQKNKNNTSFFKKLIISIKDFDKYAMFAKEGIGQTILYIVLLIFLFDIIITLISTKTIIDDSKFNINRLKEYVNTINYENGTLSINENKELEIEDQELFSGKILINTSDLNDDQIAQYREQLEKETEGIVILKDTAFFRSQIIGNTTQISYAELSKNNKIEIYFIKAVIDNWNNESMNSIISILIILGFFLVWYYVYILDTLMNALILALMCHVTVKILRLDIKFTSSFGITAHAITLPIILTLVYDIIRVFTDFTIPYFGIMYYGIAYVYILTALFMIKADNVKIQMDLLKIKEVEQRIKEEFEQKEKEEKRQKEKEDVKKRDNKREKEDNNSEEPRIKDKPEGNNA